MYEGQQEGNWKRLLTQSVFLLAATLVFSVIFGNGADGRSSVEVMADQSAQTFSSDKVLHDAEAEQKRLIGEEKEAWAARASSAGELADKVVVIDAGHGGSDTGTYTSDQSVLEKDCTLAIVKYIKELFDDTNIRVYYTRLEDKNVSKLQRVKLAHKRKADLFISIHVNAGDWGDHTSNGVEGLYSNRKYKGTDITGKKIAKRLAANVSEAVNGRNRGVRRREGLYLLGHSKVPVSILEVGYISNEKDLKYINSKKGQKAIAASVYDTIKELLKE